MTLRTATLLALVASVVALLATLVVGYRSWVQIESSTARAEQVDQAHNSYYRLRLQLENAVLVARTPSAVRSVRLQIEELMQQGRTLDYFDGQVARLMLELTDVVQDIEGKLSVSDSASTQGPSSRLIDEEQIRSVDDRLRRALLESERRSEERIRTQFRSSLIRLILTVTALGLLSFIVGLSIFRRTQAPLNALMKGIDDLGQSAPQAPPVFNIKGNDEFARLARALNSMTQRLHEQNSDLIKANDRFNQLAGTVDDLFWIFDAGENSVVYLSPAFERLYGFEPSAEKLNPEQWESYIPKADLKAYRRYIEGWENGQSEGIYRFRRPDGQVIYIHDKAYAVGGSAARTGHFVGVSRDITSEVKAKQGLEQRAREQAVLYDVVRVMAASRDSTAVICQTLVDRLPDLIADSQGGAARISLGRDRYLSTGWNDIGAAVRFPIVVQGAQEGALDFGWQVGDHQHDESHEGLRQSEYQSLEMAAAHLTSLIHNRRIESRLWQDEKLKSVGELTGGVAHDFNNLLTVIQGNVEMVQEDLAQDHPNQALLEMVSQASSHAADLTARLLAFARQQPLDPVAVDINELIEELNPIMRRSLGEVIQIHFDRGDSVWASRVDRSQLSAALLNLAINARDAMPSGGSLFIETANQIVTADESDEFLGLAPGSYVVISVSDDGCGIPNDIVTRVFEPFFTTKPKAAGTGLGLSMVYGFTKQSGGNVTVYSEPGQGTTIKLYLPKSDQTPNENQELAPLAFNGVGLRALLAEDDELVRSYSQRLLISMGFDVVSCVDADEALSCMKRESRFDLLLTDVIMPGSMDGIALGKAAIEIDPTMAILLMSGYTRDRFTRKNNMAQDVVLLNKPFRRSDLEKALQRVFSKKTGGAVAGPRSIEKVTDEQTSDGE